MRRGRGGASCLASHRNPQTRARVQGMISDLDLATEQSRPFSDVYRVPGRAIDEVAVQVVCARFRFTDSAEIISASQVVSPSWPAFVKAPCKLPAEMDSAFTAFTAFYVGLCQQAEAVARALGGHRDTARAGTCRFCTQLCLVTAFDAQCCLDVALQYTAAGAKQLSMTTLQAVVLMLFNDDATIAAAKGTAVCARSRRACTQVTVDIVMRVVHPLCCSKPPCPLLKDTRQGTRSIRRRCSA